MNRGSTELAGASLRRTPYDIAESLPVTRILAWVLLAVLSIGILAILGTILLEGVLVDGRPTSQILSELFGRSSAREAVLNTTIIVVTSATFATIIGMILALVATKMDVRWKRLFNSIPLVPLTIAPLVGAIGWMFLLAPRTGWLNLGLRSFIGGDIGPLRASTVLTVIWVTTLYVVPYVFVTMAAGLQRVNSDTLEAYLLNGTSRFGAMRRVLTDVLRPALTAGFILAALTSAVQFSIPLILQVNVIPTLIYRFAKRSFPLRPDLAAALAIVLLLFGLILTVLEMRILARRHYTSVSGKGFAQRNWSLGRRADRILKSIAVGYLFVSVVLPMMAIIMVSVQPFWMPRFSLSDLTVRHYVRLVDNVGFRSGLYTSLRLAAMGTIIILVVAVAISLTRSRTSGKLGSWLYFIGNVPLGIPSVVFALGALILFIGGPIILYGTVVSLLIVYVLHYLPIGLRNVDPVVRQIGKELEEAAKVSGAGPIRTFKDMTVPMLLPAITAAAAIVSVLLVREFPMSALLTTPANKVVSVFVVDTYENGVFPAVAVMSIVLSAVSIAGVLMFQAINARVHFERGNAKRASDGGSDDDQPDLAPKQGVEEVAGPVI